MAQAITKASQDPDLIQRLTQAGSEMGAATTPEKFAAHMQNDFKRWTAVLEKSDVQFDK
jgi:tripartite-type tricarboxylate transporter receptor subunit TctC